MIAPGQLIEATEGGDRSSAVILHGLVHRSLSHTAASLRECVIAPLERLGPVDVFFHSWDVAEIHNPRGGESGEVLDPAEVERWLPEARGLFEPQEAFDESVDWERLFLNNPMRHCCGGEEGARATLMNFRRALESQERAWRFFEEGKTKKYDLVVATRPDLRFLEKLEVPQALSVGFGGRTIPLDTNGLWLPLFHAWGGVNDRFAVGNEEAIRIWSNRVQFAHEWLLGSQGESSEWLLMKWLEVSRVRVGFLDIVFQRIRANGEVAEMDQELKAAGQNDERIHPQPPSPLSVENCGGGMWHSPKERFLILTREAGPMAESLRKVLAPLGRVEVVVDRPVAMVSDGSYIHISDSELAGYGGLMGRTDDLPPITAWTRALAHLSLTLEDNESVWMVEDDVAGDAESFAKLVELTRTGEPDLAAWDILSRDEDPEWYFWSDADESFTVPYRAFQPLCRLSPRLIRRILDFRSKRGHFIFHELLFASLARQHDMRLLDWNRDKDVGNCFSTFRYRPEVARVTRGIVHPVKDPLTLEAICRIPPGGFPRLDKASLQGWSILLEDYWFLAKLCRKHSFTRVVEFGPGDSTRAFLDAGCQVVSYEHDIGWLHRSVEMFKEEDGVALIHCPEGTVPDFLPFEPEMIFVDGPPFREGQEMSRLQPCEWALEVCGCFLLHDANRHGEQATLQEMERRGMYVTRIPTRKGLAMVVDPARRPEMISAISGRDNRGRSETTKGWFTEEFYAWSVMFHRTWETGKVLETGVSEGISANLMLDHLFTHPESEIHGIDLYEKDRGDGLRETLSTNLANNGRARQLRLYEGCTCEVLAWMIAGDGFWESFDFIHLNSAENAADMLSDACQAWNLLKSGGIMVLGGSEAARPGTDAFLSVYGERVAKIFESGRLAVMKRC